MQPVHLVFLKHLRGGFGVAHYCVKVKHSVECLRLPYPFVDILATTYFCEKLSSAYECLTALFGMGRGVSLFYYRRHQPVQHSEDQRSYLISVIVGIGAYYYLFPSEIVKVESR